MQMRLLSWQCGTSGSLIKAFRLSVRAYIAELIVYNRALIFRRRFDGQRIG